MKSHNALLLGMLAIAACGGSKETRLAADSAARDIQLTSADTTASLNDAPPVRVDTVVIERSAPEKPAAAKPRPRASAPASTPAATSPSPAPIPEPAPAPAPSPAAPLAPAQLDSGTVIEATATRALSSRTNKPGETFTAMIGTALTAEDGRVVIPAGAEVTFTIVALKPAPNKGAQDGTIELRATGVVVNGESRQITAQVTFVEHTLKGRGVTGSEAAKVGVGAAAGAIVGKVIGGKTGTVAGAVTGAAAGAAVAVESADRDVIVAVGAKIRLTLRTAFQAGS